MSLLILISIISITIITIITVITSITNIIIASELKYYSYLILFIIIIICFHLNLILITLYDFMHEFGCLTAINIEALITAFGFVVVAVFLVEIIIISYHFYNNYY